MLVKSFGYGLELFIKTKAVQINKWYFNWSKNNKKIIFFIKLLCLLNSLSLTLSD